ncbi:hypothetical protein M885DRAFT_533695 [Pelagophyceae sp. CCMP2097]|nr:hypothetical protein M885DRAFT_533695 [Pelagophyceae sp. CCMP2097]
MDLSAFKRRGSAITDELAAQDVEFAALRAKLDAARLEGERLKSAADEATSGGAAEPWRAADEHAAGLLRHRAPSPETSWTAAAWSAVTGDAAAKPAADDAGAWTDAPSIAELITLADGPPTAGEARRCCTQCKTDAYADRPQLVSCAACGRPSHTHCVGLRSIPFKKATRADEKHRELFIKRYFGDWRCLDCRDLAAAAPMQGDAAAANAAYARPENAPPPPETTRSASITRSTSMTGLERSTSTTSLDVAPAPPRDAPLSHGGGRQRPAEEQGDSELLDCVDCIRTYACTAPPPGAPVARRDAGGWRCPHCAALPCAALPHCAANGAESGDVHGQLAEASANMVSLQLRVHELELELDCARSELRRKQCDKCLKGPIGAGGY